MDTIFQKRTVVYIPGEKRVKEVVVTQFDAPLREWAIGSALGTILGMVAVYGYEKFEERRAKKQKQEGE